VPLAGLQYLNVTLTTVSGAITLWVLPATLQDLFISQSSLTGCPDFTSAVALRRFDYNDNALIQATVDAILLAMWTRRMSFTNATPDCDLGGTNATPGGVYQNASPPTTGLEYKHVLINDSDGEGFSKWAITTS